MYEGKHRTVVAMRHIFMDSTPTDYVGRHRADEEED
jgi:hypothetical protein